MANWKKLLTAAEAATTYATLDNTTLDKLTLEATGPYLLFHDESASSSAGYGNFRLLSNSDSFLIQSANDANDGWVNVITIPR